MLDIVPGAKLGRLLAELTTGEKASGLQVERTEKAKEALVEAILTGSLVIGPEEILEKSIGGRGEEGLREGGPGGLGGLGRETVLDLPPAGPIEEVLEPTRTPNSFPGELSP